MSYRKLQTEDEVEDQIELQVIQLGNNNVKLDDTTLDNLEDTEDLIPNFDPSPSKKAIDKFSLIQALKNRIGLVYTIIAALLFSVMNLMVKLSSELPSFEIVFIRSFLCLIGCLIFLGYKKVYIFGPAEKRKLLFVRGCFGFIGLSCTYYSVTVLPLSDAITLSFFNPVFTALLARIILKEKWGVVDFLCTLLSIAGVVLVARPEFIFHTQLGDGVNAGARTLAVIVALCGALSGAFAYVTVRSVGSSVNPFVLVLYFSTISTVLSLPFCFGIPSQRQKFHIPSLHFIPILLGLSTSAFFGQGLLNRGLQLEKAGRASAMNYLQIVFSLLSEVLFLNTVPEWTSVIGACLVMASSITNFVKK
eukprot:TRINITY_DN1043_c0_g3_i1.p1 TRINITY_DN1043_c0_g3~~TRINITY_DN1043_c0_g3_i1.p1  ORF type:complete len:362 (+),score=36.50 TRINITY_DN1043_c0_g3_i1:275-1360(+)